VLQWQAFVEVTRQYFDASVIVCESLHGGDKAQWLRFLGSPHLPPQRLQKL